MILYRHKGFQTSLQADPYERGIEGRPFQNFRKHNIQVKVNQELKRKQFKPMERTVNSAESGGYVK